MCDERERLIGFVYDECDADERREIARHLEECGTCRTEIAGLRDVRQDLLAWDVRGRAGRVAADGGARDRAVVETVPVWAMAAAASVMFVIGAAGGLLTHALMSDRAPAVTADARTGPSTAAVTARATDDQTLHQRIIDVLRAELASQQAARTSRAVCTSGDDGVDRSRAAAAAAEHDGG